MLNKAILAAILALFVLGGTVAARAETPLTVTGLVIDKTDKNAVLARDSALAEARRAAFRLVAQRSMTASEFKSFTMPDDKAIAIVVQDFEIKNEQLAADRYKATFTVRFTPDINVYIQVPAGVGPVIDATGVDVTAPAVAGAVEGAALAAPAAAISHEPYMIPNGARTILVLPYLKDTSGKRLLWEDPNPWREAWQEKGNTTRPPEMTFSVPQGDIDDVAAGNTEGPWSGDYTGLEKLRTAYQAGEVALAVADQSATPARVEMFMYRDGRLTRLKPLGGFRLDDADAMIARVVDALAAPQADDTPPPAPVSPDVAAPQAETPAADTAGVTRISLVMNIASLGEWADAQRRLASVTPALTTDLISLTRTAARVNVVFTGGGIEIFKASLINRGLGLGAADSSGVYELTLLPSSGMVP